MFFYLFICLLIFGIGDVLGVATKAKVSALFVSLMLFLVGFMTGVLPPDIIKLAGLTDIGKWSLILGAVIGSTGLVPLKILDHAKSSGIFNVGVFAVIIPSLAKIKVSDLLVLSFNTIMVFIVVFAVLFLFFYILPLWKILGNRNLAMGVAVMQLLGFPATYLVANEIAIATGETEEERQVVNDAIMPKYLVGGFATVTTFLVITAGILEKFL